MIETPLTELSGALLAEIEARALVRATACFACVEDHAKAADGRTPRAAWRCTACGTEMCPAHKAKGACLCAREGTTPTYASTTTAGADEMILAAEVRRARAEVSEVRRAMTEAYLSSLKVADLRHAEHAEVLREIEAIRERAAGRAEAPTDAEIDAHEAAGGRWRCVVREAPNLSADAMRGRAAKGRRNIIEACGVDARWWVIDAWFCSCDWPVVP